MIELASEANSWLPLFGAFGLGSVVTSIVSSWLGARHKQAERSFEERKEAYMGLLQAYHKAAIASPSEQEFAAKDFAYWQLRCDIVGPPAVRSAITEIIASNDDQIKRAVAHERLKRSIRKDLKISKSSK